MLRGIAISVRYVGPTTYRGSRWIARADHPIGRVVVPYSYDVSAGIDNVRIAADTLVARWDADYAKRYPDAPAERWTIVAGGHTADHGYTFIAAYAVDMPDAAESVDIMARALVGPTSGENARYLAPGTVANLDAAGYRIARS